MIKSLGGLARIAGVLVRTAAAGAALAIAVALASSLAGRGSPDLALRLGAA